MAIPEGWQYVEKLWCPFCRATLERTDNRQPWVCHRCRWASEGRHFDRAVMRQSA